METCAELPGEHGPAAIAHQRPRQPHLLQCLAQAMDQLLGARARIPLGMAQVPRPIVDEGDEERLYVLAAAGEHLARALVEVEVQELQHVLDLVAAYLSLLEPIAGG